LREGWQPRDPKTVKDAGHYPTIDMVSLLVI
jgi:hypothetical protein